MRAIFLGILISGFLVSQGLAGGKRETFAEGKISVEIPDGWSQSDLNKERTLGGWASSDKSTSVYFLSFLAGNGAMQDILDSTIENYAKQFELSKESEPKTGTIQGPGEKKWPAIYVTLEGDMEAQPAPFKMKFYLMIFDVGDAQYLIQATTTRPIWDVRERQILEMIRSVVARS